MEIFPNSSTLQTWGGLLQRLKATKIDSLAALARALSMVHVFDGAYFGASLHAGCDAGEDDFMGKCRAFHGVVQQESALGSKPLVADLLHFPGAPSFDPRPFFDESAKRLYERPLDLGRPL